MYKWCEQCGKLHWAKRDSKRFCTPRCRVAFNRGQEPDTLELPNYQRERAATLIAEHNPKAFKDLERLKDYHGQRALDLALDAICDMLRDVKPLDNKKTR